MRLILFDVDGTLVYSERRDSRCFARAYEELYGREFPSMNWAEYPHVTDTTIFESVVRRQFGRSLQEGEQTSFQQRYLQLLREGRQRDPAHSLEVPGARAAVRQLKEEGCLVGVATGGWAGPARLKLSHVGISVQEDLLSGADGKTTREAILLAVIERARAINGKIERVVYVGDAIWDVHTTRNLGLDFVGVRYRNDPEVLQRAGVGQVVTNYLDYPAFREAIARAAPPQQAVE